MADDTDISYNCQPSTVSDHGPDSAMARHSDHGPDSAMAQLLLVSSMAQRDMAQEESTRSRSVGNIDVTNSNPHSVSPQPSSWRSGNGRSRSASPPNRFQGSPAHVSAGQNRVMSPKHESERDDVQDFLHSQRQYDPMDGIVDHSENATYSLPDSSPEDLSVDSVMDSPNKVYRCRLCSFHTSTYTQLQLHMPKHGGVKALKCPLCDYSTNDKSNFRRHRRLHMGNNPVSVLKCGKCSFSTIMIRKFKEHCSQVHNEDLNSVPYSHSSHPTFPHQAYGDGVDRHFTINPPLDLHHVNHPHHAPPTNNFSASNALHSLLTGIHPTPQLYRRQTYPAQSLNQYGSYLPPMRHSNEENHMASNYLRSIVSSIMNTHPPARIPPSSTITSSGYYLSSAQHNPNAMSAAQSSALPDMQGRVKVKIEPPERDHTPDVSSSAVYHPSFSDSGGVLNLRTYPRNNGHSQESNTAEANEASQSIDAIRRTNSTDSTQSSRQGARSSVDNYVNTTVKSELVSVGTQCSEQGMKIETDINRNHSLYSNAGVDQAVQCELISTSGRRSQRSYSLASDSEGSEQQGNKCVHCGITFDDEVLYSIHIGCHSHTEPFVCNVCGKQCGNKYGFYSHIMRGHHY